MSLYSTSITESGPPTPAYTYRGCFGDRWDRALPNYFKGDYLMNPLLCAGFCQGFRYMGLEYGSQCMCGNVWPTNYTQLMDQACNYTCKGNSTVKCGGLWSLSLYSL
jgi:hypothetical protein